MTQVRTLQGNAPAHAHHVAIRPSLASGTPTPFNSLPDEVLFSGRKASQGSPLLSSPAINQARRNGHTAAADKLQRLLDALADQMRQPSSHPDSAGIDGLNTALQAFYNTAKRYRTSPGTPSGRVFQEARAAHRSPRPRANTGLSGILPVFRFPLRRSATVEAGLDSQEARRLALMSQAFVVDLQVNDANLFEGKDLSGIYMPHFRLFAPEGQALSFKDANLSQALFDTLFPHVTFDGADLSGAFFVINRHNFGRVSFRDANLTDAHLANKAAVLIGEPSPGQGAHLAGTDFTGATLVRTDLGHSNLQGANFEGADLTETDLLLADLRGADLRAKNLDRALLKGAIYDRNTQFPQGFKPRRHGMKPKGRAWFSV